MSMDIMLIKTADGAFRPATADDMEVTQNLKVGKEYGCTLTQLRNGKFHRKLFSLLKFGYDNSERRVIEHKGQIVGQSFTSYRQGIVIRAGYHAIDVDSRGNAKYVAQSLEYRKCSQELAESIYSDVIDVLCKDFGGEYSRQRLDEITEELLRYAA